MPLDPSIILGVRAPQMQDPLESYGKAAALKGLIGQQELQALQAQQVRQGIDDDNAVRDAYRQGSGNMDTIRSLLGQRGAYKQIQALDAAELARREKESTIGKNRAAAAKDDAEVQIKEAERAASMLSVAKENPEAYPAILRLAQVQFPNLAKRLPAQYDPNVIQSELAAGMTYVQRLQDQRKQEELRQSASRDAVTAANQPFLPGDNGPVPQRPVIDFKLDQAKKSAPNVSVKTDVKTGESLAGQVGPMMRDSVAAAEGAVKQVDAAQRIVNAIDGGKIIAGPLANQRITMAQVSQILGVGGKDDAEKLSNTRNVVRGLAELTLQGRQQMRGQGAITESEGKLAEKAMAGDISELTAAEIRQLARASERAARFNYTEHQRKLKVMQENPALQGISPFYQGPSMPAELSTAPAQTPRGLVRNPDGSFTYTP